LKKRTKKLLITYFKYKSFLLLFFKKEVLACFSLLVLCSPATAQTLKLATWNIEWLTLRQVGDPGLPSDITRTRDAADFAALRHYADTLNADIVAFEEVDGPEVAAQVFAPDRYTLHLTADHVTQRTGFAIRKGLAFTANPDVTSLNVYAADAPYPLRSGADITLRLGANRLRLLAVHLKTGCREDPPERSRRPACATLAAQIPPLQAWIAARQQEGVPFVIMGDFNRWMDGDDPLLAELRLAAPLVRATEGRADPCWGGGRFIDHILAGGAAGQWIQPNSLRVMVYRETDLAAKERLSDHCPVSVMLRVAGPAP
jgi:endonuclease/exonuclease/phosphatase family metal-dependent hydrolase